MSLHTLANHMSAHGRGPDSTLVHMSPREVQGLQALAMRHGGSLTINPQTGLPEAGILENLLPAIAGFALNAFAPGIGGAVGSALGLTGGMASAVGTGLIVGGVTGLASGSLEKGLMAGLGGYGGAGLGASLVGAGSPSVAMDAASGARDAGMSAAAQASPAATAARLQAGANTAMSAPVDALKNNALNLGLASAPVFMDSFGDTEEETAAPKRQSGNRYMYRDDPITGRSYAYKTYSGDEVKDSPPVVFGNAGGGLMQHYDAGGPVPFGNVGTPVDANGNPIIPATEKTISDSQRAQDYLLGKPGAVNPFLFYSKGPAAATPTTPAAALSAAGISALTPEFAGYGGRGLSQEQRDEKNDPNAWANIGDEAQSKWFAENPDSPVTKIQGQALKYWPFKDTEAWKKADSIYAGFNPKTGLPFGFVDNSGESAENMMPTTVASGAYQKAVADARAADQAFRKDIDDRQVRLDAAEKQAAQAAQNERIAEFDASREGSRGFGGGYGGGVATGGVGGDASGGGDRGTRGGFANGGGITALAQGGMYNLGSYSDGGRLLRGPGDGVSDGIPATIGQNQPARLADGEFVVPARIVSELGNGSTEAGARKLYAMMDRVQKARSKTVGKNKVAANSRADKYLPV